MPADFTPYVDLTPYDITPASAYLGAIEIAQLTLPEFELRQGTVEDSMFQAFAYLSMLNVAAINRLPSRLMVGIAKLLGVQPSEGQRAWMKVAISLYSGEAAITLPTGTMFSYTVFFDGQSYEYAFSTIEDLLIDSTDPLTPNIITVYSQRVGIHPTPDEGQSITAMSVNSSIDTVVVATTAQSSPEDYFWAGENPEDDAVYLARCTTALRSLSGAITTASQLESYILTNYANVSKCKVYDLMQATTRLLSANGEQTQTDTEVGHVYVTVYGLERLLSSEEKDTIYNDVITKCVAGIVVEIADPDILDITGAEILFSFDKKYDQTEIETLVADTLSTYLSPSGFDATKEAVFIGSIASLINKIDGVEWVEQVLFDLTGMDTGAYFEDLNYNLWFRKAGTLPFIDPVGITVTGTPI